MIHAAVKRGELKRLREFLSEAARVRPARGEDVDHVRAFAYRAGRNHARVESELRKAQGEREKAAGSDPRYLEYERRRLGIIHAHAKRDAAGAVVVDKDQNCEIPDASVPKMTREIDALGVEYKAIFREKEAYWASSAVVDFMSWDFDGVPLGVNGCTLEGIRPMLLGVPAQTVHSIAVARCDLSGLADVVRAASYARPHPLWESPADNLRWRLACGRNWAALTAALGRAQAEREAMTSRDARYAEYEARRQSILDKHAARGEDGEVSVDAEGNLDLPADKLPVVAAAIDALALEYAEPLQAREDHWIASVRVPLVLMPFRQVPRRIVGTYVFALSPMLEGIPQDDGTADDPTAAVRCGGVPFDA
jgi:hypothetical protein